MTADSYMNINPPMSNILPSGDSETTNGMVLNIILQPGKMKKFPKTKWTCVGITDLKEPVGICEMCGYQIIRYVHHMVHPSGLSLGCGCVCAGKLEGNIERAKQRESTLRTRTSRLENFLKRKWKKSAKGHEYLKIKNTVFVLFYDQKTNKWSFSVNNIFQRQTFSTKKELLEAVFTELEKIKNQ